MLTIINNRGQTNRRWEVGNTGWEMVIAAQEHLEHQSVSIFYVNVEMKGIFSERRNLKKKHVLVDANLIIKIEYITLKE